MTFQKIKLGDYCEITSSRRCHLSERSATGVPFYRSKEIIQLFNGTIVDDCDYISREMYDSIKRKYGVPQAGDLLITSRGTIGIPYLYKSTDEFYFADGNLTWLRNFHKDLSSAFLFHLLSDARTVSKIDNLAQGAAQKALSIAALKNFEFLLPERSVQNHIVSMIDAYDRLIENHRRQIALLEEAAQRIYKEWFVDSHPSHDAWTSCPLPDLMDVCYGKDHKGLADGPYPVYGSGGYLRSVDQYLYNKESILIPRKGSLNNILYVDEAFWTVDTMFYTKLKRPDVGFYLYNYLLRIDMYAMNTGAAVPSMTTNVLNKMMIPLPPQDDLAHFSDAITPMHQEIKFLKHKVQLLSEARDRLLPKLLSGEIEV